MRSVLTEFMVKLDRGSIRYLCFHFYGENLGIPYVSSPKEVPGLVSLPFLWVGGWGCLETAFRAETLSCLPSPTAFPFAQSLNNEQMRKVKASCLPVSFELLTYAVLFLLSFVSLFCYCCCCTFLFGLLFVFYFSVL